MSALAPLLGGRKLEGLVAFMSTHGLRGQTFATLPLVLPILGNTLPSAITIQFRKSSTAKRFF